MSTASLSTCSQQYSTQHLVGTAATLSHSTYLDLFGLWSSASFFCTPLPLFRFASTDAVDSQRDACRGVLRSCVQHCRGRQFFIPALSCTAVPTCREECFISNVFIHPRENSLPLCPFSSRQLGDPAQLYPEKTIPTQFSHPNCEQASQTSDISQNGTDEHFPFLFTRQSHFPKS